jgi:hypothetical protein
MVHSLVCNKLSYFLFISDLSLYSYPYQIFYMLSR